MKEASLFPLPELERFDPEEFLAADAAREGFRALVLGHYASSARSFPWRETRDPWAILVSEVMLQQTQTERVVPKYLAFLKAFPTPAALSGASLERLLSLWSGLGYNRRALNLKRAAAAIAERPDASFPASEEELRALPGVGPYTARAVLAFAFGRASAFIETNVRTVFLYHFYPDGEGVPDSLLEPLVAASLEPSDPRTWYYALMDYGAFLKKSLGNPNARSASYAKQTAFATSHRRVRGAVLKELSAPGHGAESLDVLASRIPFSRERVELAVGELVAEGFILYEAGGIRFPS